MITPAAGVVIAGRYELTHPLARGGMGSIWIARHRELDVLVAVKFMDHALMPEGDARARFEREAKAAAQIDSQHVVQVHDYGVEDRTPYIVMELLRGEDLAQRLHREPRLPLGAVATILTQIGKALRNAHGAGIVHRDLKPANIFLARKDEEEVVKILDFGIAKAIGLGLAGEVTKTGTVLGSVHFMSPEQARGSKAVDHRSDLWSLAVIVFRALTGKLPFSGHDLGDVIVKICAEPMPLALQIAPDLPDALDGFFERGLARDPARRFQSAREMVEAFHALAGGSQPLAGPTPSSAPLVRSPDWIREHATVKAESPRALASSLSSGESGCSSIHGEAASREVIASGPDRGAEANSGLRVKANSPAATTSSVEPGQGSGSDPRVEANSLAMLAFSIQPGEGSDSDLRLGPESLAAIASSADQGEESGSDPGVEENAPALFVFSLEPSEESERARLEAESSARAAPTVDPDEAASSDLVIEAEPPVVITSTVEPAEAASGELAIESQSPAALVPSGEPAEAASADLIPEAEPPAALVPSGEPGQVGLAALEPRSDPPPAMAAQPSASPRPADHFARFSSSAPVVASAPWPGSSSKPPRSRRRVTAWMAGGGAVAVSLAALMTLGSLWPGRAEPDTGAIEVMRTATTPSAEAPPASLEARPPSEIVSPATAAAEAERAPAVSSSPAALSPAATTQPGGQRAGQPSPDAGAHSAVARPPRKPVTGAPRPTQETKIPLP